MATLIAHLNRPVLSRRLAVCGAVALAGVAAVHLIDAQGTLQDNSAIGALELALAAATVPLAVLLVVWPGRDRWIAAALLCAAALGMYAASRTVGLLGSTDDVGNWLQPLGVLSCGCELAVVGLAVASLRGPRPRHRA